MGKTGTKGVIHNPKLTTKPYFIVITKNKKTKTLLFASEEEAAAAKHKHIADKRFAKEQARAALADKRAKDVQKNGNSCEQERAFLVECEERMRARGAADDAFVVLNDFTHADCLIRRALSYLQVQAKTTATKMKGQNGYLFSKVRGYPGMLVVFWVVDLQRAWIFDGTWLDARKGKTQNYYVTPGSQKSETVDGCLATNLTMDAMLTYLFESDLKPHIQLTTEDAARANIKGLNHQKEFFAIQQFHRAFPGTYEWPRKQGDVFDLVRVVEDVQIRQQHKSCCLNGNAAGLYCPSLGKNAGADLDGKQLDTCYAPDDADEYVFHWFDEATSTSHFWIIPSSAMKDHGFFTKTTGCETITLYGPEGVGKQPNPNARTKADTWTREFYAGSTLRD